MGRSVIYNIVDLVFWIYMMMLVIRILSSWFPDLQDHPVFRFLRFYTDPYLNIFRRFIPPLGIFDLSPLVAFFALQLLETFVKGLLIRL